MSYSEGRQPCDRFVAQLTGNEYAVWRNVHECFGPWDGLGRKLPGESCAVTVSFCDNCSSDHHSGGWDTCGRLPLTEGREL